VRGTRTAHRGAWNQPGERHFADCEAVCERLLPTTSLFQFSYRIYKIEYVIFKLFFLALSLYGLYKLAQQEFGFRVQPVESKRPLHDPNSR
jgi:hypothetical protein